MNPDQALLRAWSGPVSGRDCSPIAALFDLFVVDVDRDAGRVAMRFTVPAALERPDGAPTTRAVGAMLDCALGFAALATLDPPETVVTATLRIESIDIRASPSFEARGVVVARHAGTLFARASLHGADGGIVALASTTLRLVAGRS